ncbi:hypothetical protein BT63DRAFT_143557 [Microthyrium microscopicum]|uniref:Uncharacterized protein n=1 Tax=Microthyrium microscopicum TaxID=703497 RepID=A0A6A6UL48_9PEZI|nr:hypothetical protein BT63DRAFT_143557 [Microthyrium microscopicum]
MQITIRPPSSHTLKGSPANASDGASVPAPTYDWISGTWHVSYSSLPLWKGKQNVRISYKALAGSDLTSVKMPDLDDFVEYQKQGATKTSTVSGISRPVQVGGLPEGLAYAWRGKGLLMIASSNWEILAHGTDTAAAEPNDFVVTYFGKTLFTPAGLDIYTRTTSSLSDVTLNAIKAALEGQSEQGLGTLAKSMFEIPRV